MAIGAIIPVLSTLTIPACHRTGPKRRCRIYPIDGGVSGKKYWAASVNLTSYTGNSHIFGDPFANKNGVGIASFHHYQTRADGSFSHLYWLGADVRTATVLANVPEPASWALMITGFGAVGTAMRRRSGRLAFA